MASINDSLDYGNIFPGMSNTTSNEGPHKISATAKKKKGRNKNKNKNKNKKPLIHRHPLNVRIDEDLRREFVAVCRATGTSQHVPLEKALRRILREMKKDSTSAV